MARCGPRRVSRLLAQGRRLVTTSLVLCECGNAPARAPYRANVSELRNCLIREKLLVKPTPEEVDAAWVASIGATPERLGSSINCRSA